MFGFSWREEVCSYFYSCLQTCRWEASLSSMSREEKRTLLLHRMWGNLGGYTNTTAIHKYKHINNYDLK